MGKISVESYLEKNSNKYSDGLKTNIMITYEACKEYLKSIILNYGIERLECIQNFSDFRNECSNHLKIMASTNKNLKTFIENCFINWKYYWNEFSEVRHHFRFFTQYSPEIDELRS